MEVVPVLVSYHTRHWIRVAVGSYLEQFPDERLLVVDNNPKRGETGWTSSCEAEQRWLACHPQVELLDNPTPDQDWGTRSHGGGVDLALAACRARGAEVLLLLEPDCLVSGRAWRDNLLAALAAGAWMAGCSPRAYGPIHPVPTAWRVAEVRASFKASQPRAPDEEHPRYRELVHPEILEAEYRPIGIWDWWSRHWDTGEKAWFEAAVHDRAVAVPGPGFRHYWHGSYARRLAAAGLVARFPELRPYLEKGPTYGPARPVEGCPYRHGARAEGEVADCRLLGELGGVREEGWCAVGRDACAACSASWPPAPGELNPVVASLLYSLAGQVVRRGGLSGCDPARAAALLQRAEADLEHDYPDG
jgi:hypothetical protein